MRFLVLALLCVLAPAPIQASQDGRILQGGAQIYAEPTPDSPVIGSFEAGDVVRMSAKEKEGWHRVLMKRPKGAERAAGAPEDETEKKEFGWIRREYVAPIISLLEFKQAGLQYMPQGPREGGRHMIVINFLYDALALRPHRLEQATTDATQFFPSHRFGAELGVRLSTTWTLSLYGSLHQFTRRVSIGSYTGTGKDLGAVLEFAMIHVLPWKIGIALGGGVSSGTRISISSGGTTTSSSDRSPLEAIGKLTFRRYVGDHFGLGLELGARYVQKFNASFNGSSVEIDLSAPFAGAGLLIEF